MRIPLAKWTPDLPGLAGQGTNATAQNVYPYDQGYKPVNDIAAVSSNALDGVALGALGVEDYQGNIVLFAGTSDKLYKMPSSNAFSDVSAMGGYSATSSPWELVQFKETVLAYNPTDGLNYFTINSSSVFAPVSAAPLGSHVAVVRDFVVVANTATSVRQVAWSAFADYMSWTVGVNQSDTQDLPDGGIIRAVTGGEYGLIWQERAITRLTYVGPPLIFRLDKVSNRIGLAAPRAHATIGGNHFFWSHDGFYIFDGEDEPQPVGHQKVDEWFRTNCNTSNTSRGAITCVADPINKLIFTAFVSVGGGGSAVPDTVLIFNYATGDFSYASINLELLASMPSISAPYLGAFNTSHKFCSFTGSKLAAVIETSDFEPVEGQRSLITNIRPLCDTSSATGIIESRARFADSTTNTSSASMQPNGDIPVMSSGNYHKVKISIGAGVTWSFANGVDIDAQPDGEL